MLLLLLACAGSRDTDPPPATDSGGERPDTATTDTYGCPVGMAAIPTESPAWCIDAYELALVDGALVSAAGLDPVVGYTYDDAVAACAATAALDAEGEPYAMRHLATSEEWADAGDGVIGEGGARYPWGDTFDETACVTPTAEGDLQVDALQLTGSLPTCVSPFGVYDLVGNAWEWADSGSFLDVAAAIDALTASGLAITESEDDGALVWAGGSVAVLTLDVAGVQPPTMTVTPEGRLEVAATQIQPDLSAFFARGYVHGTAPAGPPLPVRLVSTDEADPEAPWRVYTAHAYDGGALPDKRGCAWYTGNAFACALDVPSYVHTPDFGGTIGFRCVAPPFPL